MFKNYDFDLIVFGSGAGGSVAAHHAHSIGKKVAVFEKSQIGGECPNWACVPTKALLHAAKIYQIAQNAHLFGSDVKSVNLNFDRVKKWRNLVVSRTGATHGEETFKKEGLHLIRAKANFISSHRVRANDKVYSASKILISTGSQVAIPPIVGLKESGYFTFKEAGDLERLPSSIFILGGGPVGCEFAQIFASFGTKVTIADSFERLLFREDPEVSKLIAGLFENLGIEVLTSVEVKKVEKNGHKKIIHFQKGHDQHQREIAEILVATGKKPVLDVAPEKAGVTINNGHLDVNSYLQTNIPHIYAAGDVVGPYLFTHTGEYQSFIAAHNAFSYHKIKVDYTVVPRCVFTYPEVASVGLSENDAKNAGIKTRVGLAATSSLGRANTTNEFDGFVKIITDYKQRIIGASIVAPTAGEMIHELALAVKLKVKAKVVADLIHAYPTFSEAIKIACSSLNVR